LSGLWASEASVLKRRRTGPLVGGGQSGKVVQPWPLALLTFGIS
jgi:hypothetical protein